MPYAVEALFEPEDERALRALWDQLSATSGSRYLQHQRSEPHLALVVGRGDFCDGLSVEVQAMAAAARDWEVAVEGVGSFPGAGVLYLAIAADPLLLAFHRRLFTAMRAWALWLDPHSWPERWRPHCTIAQRLDPRCEAAVMQTALASEWPRVLRIRELGLVRYPPTLVIGRWPLGQGRVPASL